MYFAFLMTKQDSRRSIINQSFGLLTPHRPLKTLLGVLGGRLFFWGGEKEQLRYIMANVFLRVECLFVGNFL